MTANQLLINSFFLAFQNKNYAAMQSCYAEDAVFNDEIFVGLNSEEVKAMWEMFCINGKDLIIEFANVHADEKCGCAEWSAAYTFSKTNKKVHNHIQSNFTFANGKIVKHTDSFSFYKWASQALGAPGVLLGWSSIVKTKVRKEAMNSLLNFMKNRKWIAPDLKLEKRSNDFSKE